MLKRPINSRFNQAVLVGRKCTTIRDKPWPLWKEIMLYNWTGNPYRSQQCDVAAVVVIGFWPITIAQTPRGVMRYAYGMETEIPLWQHEGFESPEELDAWFRPLVDRGQATTKTLMRFRLRTPDLRTSKPHGLA